MNSRLIELQYRTDVIKSFEFCKKMFAEGFDSENQFNTAKNICQNHVNMCNRLCKKIKPKLGFLQINKYKIYKDFWNTCNYTVNQLSTIIMSTQNDFNKLTEIEELRETMETKAFIEYEIAQRIKQLESERVQDIKECNKIGFEKNIEDND